MRGHVKMAKYKRKYPCACCGQDVTYDDKTKILSCGCYSSPCKYVNLELFDKISD